MKDFTIDTYKVLLASLIEYGYIFQTCEEFIKNPALKVVILRHDIDIKKYKALQTAIIEKEMGIKASYYFRIIKASFDPEIIKSVIAMGHELGYHYEDLSAAGGNYELAIKSFERNLEKFRKFYPVKTICMHGSSRSKYDNRDLWNKYDYKDYGITCEPYLDLDFNDILYLTDTAQSWDGSSLSIRDKVESKYNYKLKTTFDILNSIKALPNRIMITMHPDRWAASAIESLSINTFVFFHMMFKKYLLKNYHAYYKDKLFFF